jgi:hypothetical protein
MTNDHQQLIATHRARLHALEQQHDAFGALYAPAHIVVEIEQLRALIAELETDSGPLPDVKPLRMLALVAAPLVAGGRSIAPLAVQAELNAIVNACRLAGLVALDIQIEIATANALNRIAATLAEPFDILHFTGHGSGGTDGVALVLENDDTPGAARMMRASKLLMQRW